MNAITSAQPYASPIPTGFSAPAYPPPFHRRMSQHPLLSCVPGPSTNEFSEAGRNGPQQYQCVPSPVSSTVPAKRPGPSHVLPQSKRPALENEKNSINLIDQAIQLLRDGFHQRQLASSDFPPLLPQAQIRASIAQYQDYIESASKQGVCSSCGVFVPVSDIVELADDDPLLEPLRGYLDHCGRHEADWDVCLTCLKSLSQSSLPKFSALNRVNLTMCQDYPPALQDLTPVEECLIAKCHPLGIILKLRPGGHTTPAAYRALRGHFIVIP